MLQTVYCAASLGCDLAIFMGALVVGVPPATVAGQQVVFAWSAK